jgi:hypothetical protein
MMRAHRLRGAIAAVAAVLVATGCARSDEPQGAFSDEVLFAAIESLPGVVSSTVTFQDTLGTTRMYSGTVTVADDADALCVLYQAAGVLEQGRPQSDHSGVSVVQDGQRTAYGELPFRARATLDGIAPTSSTEPTVPDCAGALASGTTTR